MKRAEYVQHCMDYFRDKISIKELIELLEKGIEFSISGEKLIPDERFLIIANHQLPTPELYIPAKEIEKLKGGNKYGYETFHFPILAQILFQKLIEREFTALVDDVGWIDVARELDYTVVEKNSKNKLQNIISQLKKSQKPVLIFPEGGARRLSKFYSGFLYIALSLEIRYLVTAVMSPRPSLDQRNFLKVIEVLDLISLIRPNLEEFSDKQRIKIVSTLKNLGVKDFL